MQKYTFVSYLFRLANLICIATHRINFVLLGQMIQLK